MSETVTCAKCMYTARFTYTSGEIAKIFFENHDCESTKLQQAIERVRELHKPFGENNEWCDHCEIGQNSGYEWADYPCDTIKALDGRNDL